MILDLKKLFVSEGCVLPIEYQMDMSEVDFSGEFPLNKPVKLSGSVSNRASVVELDITVNYVFSANCHRCGVFCEHTHTVEIKRVLATRVESEENDSIIAVPDMKLDLDELVFGEVYMSLPTKHLCKEDCKGVCSKCGKDLNQGECGCPTKEIDPRLAKLAELLKN